MELSITITGGPDLQAKLNRLGKHLTEFGPVLKTIGGRLVKYYSTEPFIEEGAMYGASWAALSPAYEQWKTVNYPGKGILQRTTHMQNSFFAQSGSSTLEVGNRAPYFQKHQLGIGVPQRLVMAITRDNVSMITGLIKLDIEHKLANA